MEILLYVLGGVAALLVFGVAVERLGFGGGRVKATITLAAEGFRRPWERRITRAADASVEASLKTFTANGMGVAVNCGLTREGLAYVEIRQLLPVEQRVTHVDSAWKPLHRHQWDPESQGA